MRKLILAGLLVFGMMSFAAKITTNNTTWKKLWDAETDRYSSLWMDENETYKFLIYDNDKHIWKLYQVYEDKENTGGEIVETDKVNLYGSYVIHPSGKKGIYYVNNFIDLKGKKYKRLYFGFDEKLKTVVITDKDGNIIKKLNRVMGN